MLFLGLLFQLSYAILGKNNVHCWTVKEDNKMNTPTCFLLAACSTFKYNPRMSLGLKASDSWIEAEDKQTIQA